MTTKKYENKDGKFNKQKWIEENRELFNKNKKDLQVFLMLSLSFLGIAIVFSMYYLVKAIMS